MKILMVNSSRIWGGAEEYLLQLSLELKIKGHHLGFFLRKDSVTIRRFEEAGFPVWCGRRRGMGLVTSILKLSSIMRSERFDLIHIHRSHDIIPTALANFAAGLSPMVLTQHAWEFSKSSLQCLVYGTLTRIVAVSEAVAGKLREAQPYIADRTVVIHYGIPIKCHIKPDCDYWKKRLGLTGAEPLLGIVGFFHKNQQELIGLLPKIRETFPDVKLILIGAIDERKHMLEDKATRLEVIDALIFAGLIPHEEMLDALGALDLNVSMHRNEPFALHVVEGMAAGTPLVAYRAGGFPEIVQHEQNGYLAETREEMLQAILDLLGDREKREEMGKRGIERVFMHFTLDRMVSDYEALYRDIKK